MSSVIQGIDPSLPWMWTAILAGRKDDTTPQLTLSSALATAGQVVSGTLADVLLSAMGSFGRDVLFGKLIQDVQVPPFGVAIEYVDLGFVRYPTASQVITDPIPMTWLETSDAVVARYFLEWLNEVSPVMARFSAFKGGLSVDNTIAFEPLDKVARTLYLIKTRRDASLGAINYVLERLQAGQSPGFETGFDELPVQVYCFPKVIPQKIADSKFDKTELNSLRTVQVTLERIPTLTSPSVPSSIAGSATPSMMFLSAYLGVAKAATAVADGLLGAVTAGTALASGNQQQAKIYIQSEAEKLVSLSKQGK